MSNWVIFAGRIPPHHLDLVQMCAVVLCNKERLPACLN